MMKKGTPSLLGVFCIIGLLLIAFNLINGESTSPQPTMSRSRIQSPTTYTSTFPALNTKESMTLSPMFTPDNALDIHVWWLSRANTSIEIQNQYITQFNSTWYTEWDTDANPIVRAIVDANQSRGVNVRIQVRDDADSDNVTDYLLSKGIEVRWMGTQSSTKDNSWLSSTHNKLVLIDDKVTLLSSINFGENAFKYNREAGIVIQSATVTNYYKSIFEEDWADGEIPIPAPITRAPPAKIYTSGNNAKILSGFASHTNIPRTNFTGTYNVTLFTNPDNADDVIFRYLKAATTSVYVSMYTISRPEFNKTLIDLKKANPNMDIHVLISNRRVGSDENLDTKQAAQSLVDNLIPVYNSTTGLNYYHNKYWIIDGKHTFVYSGNWSPRSVTPNATSYGSSSTNRDMGIAIHDATDIASFFKTEVWDKDIAAASPWELPIGIKQTSFSQAEVVMGSVTLGGQISGLNDSTVSYRWDTGSFTSVTLDNDSFTISYDTVSLSNGIHAFEVRAISVSLGTFTDSATVNVVNQPAGESWKFLITELLPNPASPVLDSEGEYFEIANSYSFSLLIEGWQVGDEDHLHTFPIGTRITAGQVMIIARNETGFQGAYGFTADIELPFTLVQSGDFVQLLDVLGQYVDVVAYGSASAPDGSEVLSTPNEGEALLRVPADRDTNSASDFTVGTPDPGFISTMVSSEDTPWQWEIILVALVWLPLIRSRRRTK
ncbi:MAG: phospholipase D-like domain-containing protein [Candidatus Thorarchaeota archaeon]